MAVRAVEWPRDIAVLARSLARSDAWFWLDGAAPDPDAGPGRSYLGESSDTRIAEPGRERDFLHGLRATAHAADGAGWVVALGYEFGVALVGEDPADDDAPPAMALRAETVLVLDHARGIAELHGPDDAALSAWLERHGASLGRPPRPAGGPTPPEADPRPPHPHSPSELPRARWRCDEPGYLARVEACKAAIREGEAYVLCLTDTAEAELSGADLPDATPLPLYLRLRAAGAATRGAVIVAEGRALVSTSPERFLSLRGRTIATHPIKGTRPRGGTPEEDAILAADLAADPKERAENLMIVDLMRNDLSRVCDAGTVRTEGFLRVETHPRVHQLVSTVSGRLRDGADIFDAIGACFPGGSMTGAPKRRAVQLLAELERGPRGLYSGCFGWLGSDGDAELAMAIRCVELRGLGTPRVRARAGAGGGITADSDPAAEYAEKQLKAASLLAALARS